MGVVAEIAARPLGNCSAPRHVLVSALDRQSRLCSRPNLRAVDTPLVGRPMLLDVKAFAFSE